MHLSARNPSRMVLERKPTSDHESTYVTYRYILKTVLATFDELILRAGVSYESLQPNFRGGQSQMQELSVEAYDNSPHDFALFEILPWAGGMAVVTGDAGIGDGNIGPKPLELVTIFKR